MDIKLIIFDLDGVLTDTKMIHYYSLNNALKEINEKYIIGYDEHLARYDALPTRKKLELLTQEKNLPKEYHDKIFNLKQEKTLDLINNFSIVDDILTLFIKTFILSPKPNLFNTLLEKS